MYSNLAVDPQAIVVDKVPCEINGAEDNQPIVPSEKEYNDPHLHQSVLERAASRLQSFEDQPLYLLGENLKHDTMEVEDDASSRTCGSLGDATIQQTLLTQTLEARMQDEQHLASSNKPMLTIILSLCGLLLRRCWQKSKKLKSLKFEHEYIVLRPGCIEFLKYLLSHFNVGIWSAAIDTHVVDIIKILEKEAKEELPFFMIWGQSQCQPCVEARITRPDNPGVEALFKPLAIASKKFGIDAKQMLLVDDAPLKGCVNPTANCIFPPSFNVNEEDTILLGELLPYIKSLQHVNDIRTTTSSCFFGQAPIVQGHELYSRVHMVIAEWEERNLACFAKIYSTGRLPKVSRPLDGNAGAASSNSKMSTRSQERKLPALDQQKVRLLKNIKSLSVLKDVEAIMLAQKLGYKEPVIRVHEAKNYIKQLQAQYKLK